MDKNRSRVGEAALIFLFFAIGTIASIFTIATLTSCSLVPGNTCTDAEITTAGILPVGVMFLATGPAFVISAVLGLVHVLTSKRRAGSTSPTEPTSTGVGTLSPTGRRGTNRIAVSLFVATFLILAFGIIATMVTGDGAFLGNPRIDSTHSASYMGLMLFVAYLTLAGAIAAELTLARDALTRR